MWRLGGRKYKLTAEYHIAGLVYTPRENVHRKSGTCLVCSLSRKKLQNLQVRALAKIMAGEGGHKHINVVWDDWFVIASFYLDKMGDKP